MNVKEKYEQNQMERINMANAPADMAILPASFLCASRSWFRS
jgi:hypothetical protein